MVLLFAFIIPPVLLLTKTRYIFDTPTTEAFLELLATVFPEMDTVGVPVALTLAVPTG